MRLNYPEILPITSHHDEIVKAIEENQVVVVVGETGSGKSTQIPKMIMEAIANLRKTDPTMAEFKIACTQPRRIAAVSIAAWMAQEMEVELGKEVGYKIRFDDDTTAGTVITICTDGILLQEMKGDGLLSRYEAILVDEAHERNLNIDFLLGLIKDIQYKRRQNDLPELKILVTSATFDAQKFADFFIELNVDGEGRQKSIPIINVSGRLYPVEIRYNPIEQGEDMFRKIAGLIRGIVETREGGDVLVFMPGESEIFSTIREIEVLGNKKIKCLPLYSRLSMDDQELIYQAFPGQTKVVVATNIAETSLTVPGIKYVIDTGLARITDFNFRTGIGSLEVKPVSQASAIQRAGRAGRVEPGVCIRLYEQMDFEQREQYTKPEIQRSDLSSVVLHMLLIGIHDLTHFSFIDAPEPKAFRNAIANLIELGALDDKENLTELGVKMAHLPLEPRISAMLLAAEKYDCVREVAIIASSLSVKDPFLRPNGEEDEADRAKRYFQKIALGGGLAYKTLRIKRGRRFITKRILDKYAVNRELASDLLVFLVVWNKLQSFSTDLEREMYCQSNYLNYLIFKEIEQIYRQLLDTLNIFAKDEFSKYLLSESEKDLTVSLENREGILKSISSGFIQNLCESTGKQTYKSRGADNVLIHPGSALFTMHPKFFVAAEIVETTRLFARNNTAVDPKWFEEIAPQLCKVKKGQVWFDRRQGRVVREEEVFFRGMRIVKDRLVDLAGEDMLLAQDYFVREGLVKKQLAGKYLWLEDNDKIIAQLKVYAAKLERGDYAFTPAKLKDWYIDKFNKAKRVITSVAELDALLREKGETYLSIKIEEIIAEEERARLDKIFPAEVYLSGKKYEVKYYFDDYRYPNGPVIHLTLQDLMPLSDHLVEANLKNYQNLHPYFVVGGGESGGAITEGDRIEEIKENVDRWNLKKHWKKLRREEEVKGIRFDEVFHYLPDVIDKKEVGTSLFKSGPDAIVYAFTGLRLDGKKIIRTIFEEKETAWRATVEVLKALFLWQTKYAFFFKESQIIELEKKYEKYFYGIDLQDVLAVALWKCLDFEKRFEDIDTIKNISKVKSVLDAERLALKSYKEKIISKLKKILKKMTDLAQSERTEDLEELAKFKKQIESADLIN